MKTTENTTTTTTTTVTDCCNEQNKTVVGECTSNVIYLPCPFTENQISDKLAHISVYKQNYTPQSPNAVVSITDVKVCAVERSVGLNPHYRIELENAEDGKYQVLFASASFITHEPPQGFGGAQPIGDIG